MSGCILALRILTIIFTTVALVLAIVACISKLFALEGDTPSSFTLWEFIPTKDAEGQKLSTEYFSCADGALYIQGAQATAVIACVLCCANLFLAIFSFLMEHVVRMPLALYSFLAAGAEAASLGIVLHLYSIGWCGAQSLEKQGYKLSTGFALMLVSTLLSLASSVLAMMRFKCCR